MKAIILSCGTGGGHNAAGLAVKEELESRGHSVLMLNPYSLKSERTERIINQVYIKTVQKAPRVFGAVYALGNAYRRLPFRPPVYFVNGGMAKRLDMFFKEEKPDIVIMPHVFPAEIITNMKSLGINQIYHHVYEFGTTGLFIAMGKERDKPIVDGKDEIVSKKQVGLGVVTDERFCDGMYFARAFKLLRRYLGHPELLEKPLEKIEEDVE